MKKVAIIMGSDSDLPIVTPAIKQLKELGIETEVRVMSAHRTPKEAQAFSENAASNGFGVIIAAAGMAAHLGGVLAASTTLPVIGIPCSAKVLDGMDAMLATVMMPPGIPVATVGVNAAKNAALLAAEILAVADDELSSKLQQMRDMILLQEVDFDSHRSYGIHEYDSLKKALPGYEGWSAWNYVSDFVPIPISSPMGRVKSGLVTFSRWRPDAAIRYAYPGGFAFPVRLFNLKRCLLSLEIPVWDTTGEVQWAYINNTHNTAYDTGNIRSGEMAFLNRFLHGKRYSLTMGDWNSNPPGYTPSQAAVEDAHFSPLQIEREDFSSDLTFVYDPTTPSTRYGYEPYDRATTTTTLLDFGLCGPGIEPVAFETVDLGFRHSDHNPIIGLFVLR